MKLVPIFTAEHSEDGLWSIQLDDESQNEFERFFDAVNDIELLHDFFYKNKADLHGGYFGHISMRIAVSRTFTEAEEMEDTLYKFSEGIFEGNGNKLQHLFKPLNNFEYAITALQKSKARVRMGWLRIYAIRLAENCFLVTGGAIKLSADMKRVHLQHELKKLDQTKQFLHNNGIYYPEDLNNCKNE